MNAFDHRALEVGLKALSRSTQVGSQPGDRIVDLGKRGGSVLRGVALTEHVEVQSMQNEKLHGWVPKA